MNFTGASKAKRDWIIGIALFVLTMALYWPVTSYPFVNYDDHLYVYNNPHVVKGLSWSGIKWAFTAVVAGNWHPLTLISHMTDCSLYHLMAGGHHLTNLLLHCVNVVLLWLLMRRMTGNYAISILIAGLFAWHPLNVESVAWISERKNVLSTFFFLLTLMAYLRYAEKPQATRYFVALVLFSLGLLCKPMLVTAPFLLLLLDYWPLQRIFPAQNQPTAAKKILLILLEKVPFLLLAVADCVVTYLAQSRGGSVASFAGIPIAWRLVNIPVAYLEYLEKAFLPLNLCVIYPYPEKLPVACAVISTILLIIGTFAAWYWRRKYRWLPVGWLWFLGALIPVIGVVQTGAQVWADRHAYVPLIGIFLIIACALNECWSTKPSSRSLIVVGVAVFLFSFVALARQQIDCWRNSVALFQRAVAVNPNDALTQDLLGAALNAEGQLPEAIQHFEMAVRLQPLNADFQYKLGVDLFELGNFPEAAEHLAVVLQQQPNNAALHDILGVALMQSGKPRDAEMHFTSAIKLLPDDSKPYFNLGKALLQEGQPQPAITNFVAALRLEPNWPEAMENLARAYASAGDLSNAVLTATNALKMAQANQQTELAEQISRELAGYQMKPVQPSTH